MFSLNTSRIYAALLICLMVIVASCGGGGSSTPSPTPTPTPTVTPTPVPTPTPTPTGERPDEAPEGGVSVIDTTMANAVFWGGDNDGSAVGSRQTVDVEHEEFSQATRITVSNPSGEFWNGQLFFPINNVSVGDVVLIHLYFRSVENTYESGNAFATVFLENADFEKYVSREVSAAAEWQEYYLPVEITADKPATELVLKVGFGGGDRAQVFDIAGIELLNYGNSLEVTDLPLTLPSYEGREQDAEWRAAAAARIEQHRKGDFQLTVLDAENAPAANATVAVRFKKHAYHFGSITVGHRLMGTGADNETYREKVLELFNQSGPENDLKWGPWIGEWGSDFNQQTTLDGLQWLRDHGLYTRGHVLVWPSKRNLPEIMQEYLPEDDPANADEQALQVILDHIDDITLAAADYVDEWDVVNEPYDNHYLMDAFGNQIMVDWFNRARTNLPSHGLYLNDYGILSASGRNLAHQQHFEDTIQYLLDNDAPITGMGMQSHFGESPTSIPLIYSVLERYHTAFPNLAIRSTEFDIDTTDEEMQADYTRDFVTIFFSHPATVGVQMWGFWAGAHWTPNGALYTQDWREKPNAVAWKELIYSDWWNDFDGQTDAQGTFSERGFYGDYEVTVTIGEDSRAFEFSLSAEGPEEFEFSFAE